MEMNLSAWLSSLIAAESIPTAGFTSRELRIHLRITERRARELIRQWFDAGKLEHAGYRRCDMADGRPYNAPVYRIRGEQSGEEISKPEATKPAPRPKTKAHRR